MKTCRNMCSFILVVVFLLLWLVFHNLLHQMNAPVHLSSPAHVPRFLVLTPGPPGSRLKPWGDRTSPPPTGDRVLSGPSPGQSICHSALLFLSNATRPHFPPRDFPPRSLDVESAGSQSRSCFLSAVSALRAWNSRIDNKACSVSLASTLLCLMFYAVLDSLEQGTASSLSLVQRPFYITQPFCLSLLACSSAERLWWLDGRLVLNIFIFCRNCSWYNKYKCILHLIHW